MASYHLDGEALIWFQEAEQARGFASWEVFVQALQTRFRTTAYDDPMEALTRLKQVTFVVAYKGNFEILSNRITVLSESHKLSCFLSGLKDEIRLPVRMLVPKTLNEAFGLAKIQEEYVNSSRKGFRGVTDNGKASILGTPKLEARVEPRTKVPLQRLTVHKWRKGGNMGCVTIVMRSGRWATSVRELNYFCWRKYPKKWNLELQVCSWLRFLMMRCC